MPASDLLRETAATARSATLAVFFLNGLAFASWAARIPAAAQTLDIGPGQIGVLLLVLGLGSVLVLPLAGPLAARLGTANTVRAGGVLVALAMLGLAGALQAVLVPAAAAALFGLGVGIACWDVAMNIEGADVERQLRRTVMPQFHAAFSLGAFAGALAGAGLSALQVPLSAHLACLAVLVAAAALALPRAFLPPRPAAHAAAAGARGFGAWREPRTVLIGVVVLGAALTEGAANDWIAKAAVDGLGASAAEGALVFAVFVAAMTAVRLAGGRVVDRLGRVPVLRLGLAAALAGLLLFVLAPNLPLALVGAVLWGFGAALGFPLGMSAAAEDPARAAGRVSVVSTLGYVAFLAGPPFLGFLGQHVGVRNSLLAVAVLITVSALAAPAAREQRRG
ncbi:MFS transporter [Arthrobacter sp. I2-34]|uniref:MFS transporter n=1 Tax=Arthrobacter hankyongi TaxID=2904801 RepID=A0ABS9L562_9MICC|nr:MFS transporter [Arthrobacter hankyongi]MCG2621806.1 MFS transporter [Arthrobacter hankyongi]